MCGRDGYNRLERHCVFPVELSAMEWRVPLAGLGHAKS